MYISVVDLYSDLWVESFLNMIESVTKQDGGGYSNGYYIYDCEEYYFQQPYGVLVEISYCAYCHKNWRVE